MGHTTHQIKKAPAESHDITSSISDANLLYVSKSVFDSDWPSAPHSHYFSELFFILDGEGSFVIENIDYPVKKNDMVFINPHSLHTETSNTQFPLKYIVLGIEGVVFSTKHNNLEKKHVILNYSKASKEIVFFLENLITELERKVEDYEYICQNLLSILLIYFSRNSNHQLKMIIVSNVSKECADIKKYIDFNYTKIITLNTLAKVAHLNKYYLSHEFASAYGISPINYLIDRRIDCAKQLLLNSDVNIATVAQSSGFSSQSYFSQIFKKRTNLTPLKYRNNKTNDHL